MRFGRDHGVALRVGPLPYKGHIFLELPSHWQIGGVFLAGIGALVLGVILMIIYRFVNPAYFRGETLNKDTALLVTEEPAPPAGQATPAYG